MLSGEANWIFFFKVKFKSLLVTEDMGLMLLINKYLHIPNQHELNLQCAHISCNLKNSNIKPSRNVIIDNTIHTVIA